MRHRLTKKEEAEKSAKFIELWDAGYSFESIGIITGSRLDIVRRLLLKEFSKIDARNKMRIHAPRTKFVVKNSKRINNITDWNFNDYYEVSKTTDGTIIMEPIVIIKDS